MTKVETVVGSDGRVELKPEKVSLNLYKEIRLKTLKSALSEKEKTEVRFKDLIVWTGRSKSTMSRCLKTMLKEGVLGKHKSEETKKWAYHLTGKGVQLLIVSKAHELYSKFFQGFQEMLKMEIKNLPTECLIFLIKNLINGFLFSLISNLTFAKEQMQRSKEVMKEEAVSILTKRGYPKTKVEEIVSKIIRISEDVKGLPKSKIGKQPAWVKKMASQINAMEENNLRDALSVVLKANIDYLTRVLEDEKVREIFEELVKRPDLAEKANASLEPFLDELECWLKLLAEMYPQRSDAILKPIKEHAEALRTHLQKWKKGSNLQNL